MKFLQRLNIRWERLVGRVLKSQMNPVNRRMGPFFISYRPDFVGMQRRTEEFRTLYKMWVRGNVDNNSGDVVRLHTIFLNLKHCIDKKVPGAVAELGVYKGNSAQIIHHLAPDRKLFLLDTFQGFDNRDLRQDGFALNSQVFKDVSLADVMSQFNSPNVIYCVGHFPESAIQIPRDIKFCFVHIDCDLGPPCIEALRYFYPRMSPGGYIVVHDYASGCWPALTKAVDIFISESGLVPVFLPDKSGTVIFTIS